MSALPVSQERETEALCRLRQHSYPTENAKIDRYPNDNDCIKLLDRLCIQYQNNLVDDLKEAFEFIDSSCLPSPSPSPAIATPQTSEAKTDIIENSDSDDESDLVESIWESHAQEISFNLLIAAYYIMRKYSDKLSKREGDLSKYIPLTRDNQSRHIDQIWTYIIKYNYRECEALFPKVVLSPADDSSSEDHDDFQMIIQVSDETKEDEPPSTPPPPPQQISQTNPLHKSIRAYIFHCINLCWAIILCHDTLELYPLRFFPPNSLFFEPKHIRNDPTQCEASNVSPLTKTVRNIDPNRTIAQPQMNLMRKSSSHSHRRTASSFQFDNGSIQVKISSTSWHGTGSNEGIFYTFPGLVGRSHNGSEVTTLRKAQVYTIGLDKVDPFIDNPLHSIWHSRKQRNIATLLPTKDKPETKNDGQGWVSITSNQICKWDDSEKLISQLPSLDAILQEYSETLKRQRRLKLHDKLFEECEQSGTKGNSTVNDTTLIIGENESNDDDADGSNEGSDNESDFDDDDEFYRESCQVSFYILVQSYQTMIEFSKRYSDETTDEYKTLLNLYRSKGTKISESLSEPMIEFRNSVINPIAASVIGKFSESHPYITEQRMGKDLRSFVAECCEVTFGLIQCGCVLSQLSMNELLDCEYSPKLYSTDSCSLGDGKIWFCAWPGVAKVSEDADQSNIVKEKPTVFRYDDD